MSNIKNIVITAGGTSEPIDKVRKITNSSTGKLGMYICNELLQKDSNCIIHYVHSKNAILPNKNERIIFYQIEGTADLEKTLTEILTTNKIDIVIHAMAVSDYTTKGVSTIENFANILYTNIDFIKDNNRNDFVEEVKNLFNASESAFKQDNTDNKISSNYDNLLISLKPTTKIISLIKKISPFTFLVGFKLLDNVLEKELFDVGFNLLRKNRCNLVLANDLSLIRQGKHTGLLIYPEKKYDKIQGKENIAKELVDVIYKRAFVKHPQSLRLSENKELLAESFEEFHNIGQELFVKGFLPVVINHDRIDKVGTYGNMSIRSSLNNNLFHITGRNVHKGNLSQDDICLIENVKHIDDESVYCKVEYRGKIKPSIDTAIHSEIYELTNHNAIIHIHTDKVFLGLPITDYNYPCGSMEEKDSIIKFIRENPDNDIIQLYKHGLIIMGNTLPDCYEKLNILFSEGIYVDYTTISAPNAEFSEHVKEVKAESIVEKGTVYPIMKDGHQIAILWECRHKEYIDFGIYTYSEIQGKGYNIARKIIEMYGNNTLHLHTMKDCNVKDFYMNKFGFKVIKEDGEYYILER